MSQNSSYYSYGHSLPEVGSGSDETIVNRPSAPTLTPCGNTCCSKDSCGCSCQIRESGQPNGFCHCNQGNPGQEQQLMPVPMGVDPCTGFPIYCYSTPGNYPTNPMCSMPAMQVDQMQRGGGGQHNLNMGTTSLSSAESCLPNVASASSNQISNKSKMADFMRKYQKSVEQCYASAQQGKKKH